MCLWLPERPVQAPCPHEYPGFPGSRRSSLAGPVDDGAVGIAEYDLCAHADQFVSEEHPAGIHPVMEKHAPIGLGCCHDSNAHQVGWESGPGHHTDLRDGVAQIHLDLAGLIAGNENVFAIFCPGVAQVG